jgi:endonuclease YncB( thermonuclease family)
MVEKEKKRPRRNVAKAVSVSAKVLTVPATPPDVLDLLVKTDPLDVGLPKGCARPCRVVHVVDGDTVRVVYAHANGKSAGYAVVRLAHIQAPEMHGEDRSRGIQARHRLAELVTDCGAELPGESVESYTERILATNKRVLRLVVVVERDKYGRTVAELWPISDIDGVHVQPQSVNEVMLSAGYAGAYNGTGDMPQTQTFWRPEKT